MFMPRNTYLVRHGKSGGNEARERWLKYGDESLFTEEFLNQHTCDWRLTSKGVLQARAAGIWLQGNMVRPVGRFGSSAFARAGETSGEMGIPEALWYESFLLQERAWGEMGHLPPSQVAVKFADELRMLELDPLGTKPPGGESILEMAGGRVKDYQGTLMREVDDDSSAVIVCHGEWMWAWRILTERMSRERYLELHHSRDPLDRIHNCQILHYTRTDPVSGEVAPYYKWMRSICPWDTSLSRNVWEPIIRPVYTNEELLARVHQIPRIIDN
jgi:broad specificity phosphatase PhoE